MSEIEIPTFLIEEMERRKRERNSPIQIPLYLPIPEYPVNEIKEEDDEEKVEESRIIVINM